MKREVEITSMAVKNESQIVNSREERERERLKRKKKIFERERERREWLK